MVKNNIKFSVVIPVYNSEKVLSRCLEHVINQSYTNLEILLVNDGSTDTSKCICDTYAKKDKRIKVITQENSGPATARNTGMLNASGDYIHFCDSDDFIDLNYYECVADAIQKSCADIVVGNVIEKGFLFPCFDKVMLLIDLFDKICYTRAYDFNTVWRFVYKRSFLEKNKINFINGMFWGEDTCFMSMALYYSNMIVTAPKAFYHCINTPNSLGKNVKKIVEKRGNGSSKSIKNYEQWLEKSGLISLYKKAKKESKLVNKKYIDICGLHIFIREDYANGDIKWYFLGIPVLRKMVTTSKKRFYLFGLYLCRSYEAV